MYKLLNMDIKMSICKISRKVNGLKAFQIYKKSNIGHKTQTILVKSYSFILVLLHTFY